jgi:hypothetical protein
MTWYTTSGLNSSSRGEEAGSRAGIDEFMKKASSLQAIGQ